MLYELTNDDIDTYLTTHTFGNLGCCLRGKPYVFPTAYVFHDDVLYGQTTIGKKVEAARESRTVCFSSSEMSDAGWQSVMCWGKFEELEFGDLEPGMSSTVVRLLTERIGSIQHRLGIDIPFEFEGGVKPGTIDGKQATLFRITVNEKSGRKWVP